MLRKCKNCDREFQGTVRANFCSDSCRVAFNRSNSSVTTKPSSVTSSVTKPAVTEKSVTELSDNSVTELSPTDRLFQQDAADRDLGSNWLAFSPITRNPACKNCGKKFKTQLSMLSYCSPNCRSAAFAVPGRG